MLVLFFVRLQLITTLLPAPRWLLIADRFETTGQRFACDTESFGTARIIPTAPGVAMAASEICPDALANS
jgi:hypothetical protein